MLEKIIRVVKKRKVYPSEMLKLGGNWLGTARSWIQLNAWNGETVTWGSHDRLNLKSLSVYELEAFAAEIALATIEDVKNNLVTDDEIRALRLYRDRNNWSSSSDSLDLNVFKVDPGRLHYLHYYYKGNGWEIAEFDEEEARLKLKEDLNAHNS